MRISPDVVTAVLREARRAAPFETCGALLERGGEIVEAVAVTNRATGPNRFEADGLELAEIERWAGRAGFVLAGYFHTHPGEDAAPSAADRAGVVWPGLQPNLHLIVAAGGAWGLYAASAGGWANVQGAAEEARTGVFGREARQPAG